MPLDIDNLKFIPADKVPLRKETKWDEIFNRIPAGSALVISDQQTNIDSLVGALHRRQRRRLFKHLRAVTRGKKGNRTAYIINTTKA